MWVSFILQQKLQKIVWTRAALPLLGFIQHEISIKTNVQTSNVTFCIFQTPTQGRRSILHYFSPNARNSPLKNSPLKSSPLKASPLKHTPLKGSPHKHSPAKNSPLCHDSPRMSPRKRPSPGRRLDLWCQLLLCNYKCDGLVQDCSISIANTQEILQSWTNLRL